MRREVEQCAEVGFEMVIMSFGSGFEAENEAPDYIAQVKELADYAHARGIELGGYSLLASRSAGAVHDVLDAQTAAPEQQQLVYETGEDVGMPAAASALHCMLLGMINTRIAGLRPDS